MRSIRVVMALAAALTVAGCQNDKPKSEKADQNETQLTRTEKGSIAKTGTLTPVVLFPDLPMPTGVAVAPSGRIFVNYPRWGDPVEYSVVEIKDGKPVPFPNAGMNKLDKSRPGDSLIGVQSVVADARDRLWIVDTASINFQPIVPGGAKLVCVDLKTNQVVKKIVFPPDVALPTTYANDVRFDFTRGSEGMAFLTDSSDSGPNGIMVVDLASGKAWRKLNDHPSTKADRNFSPRVEGQSLMARLPNRPPAFIKIGSDGIAINPSRKLLYYRPLASHKLSTVSLDALSDQNMPDADVAKTVKDLGPLKFASDGMECDSAGNLYLTDYENNAIHVRTPDGNERVLAQDPAMIWPDSMAIGADGYLYVTANQLNRQKNYHDGKDLRKPPFVLFKTKALAGPQK